MSRLPELTIDTAPVAIQNIMAAQQALFGFVLNPTKVMGYCPSIVEGATALGRGIDKAGHIEARLRYLLYTYVASLNDCPF
jgi:hypothetical protein